MCRVRVAVFDLLSRCLGSHVPPRLIHCDKPHLYRVSESSTPANPNTIMTAKKSQNTPITINLCFLLYIVDILPHKGSSLDPLQPQTFPNRQPKISPASQTHHRSLHLLRTIALPRVLAAHCGHGSCACGVRLEADWVGLRGLLCGRSHIEALH